MPRRRPTEAERAERREADRRRAQEAVEALRSSEGWQRWLGARRHFHSYSFGNQLLIAQQCPGASAVAGFKAWLRLGYCVRRGERAIRIWVPMRVRDREAEDPEARRTIFRLGPVFDRSQVEPLPPPAEPAPLEPPTVAVEGDSHRDLLAPLGELARELGVSVEVCETPGASHGFFSPTQRRIGVSAELSGNAQVATLIHELAHALTALEREDEDPELSYAAEELVVESTAFTVSGSIGLDTIGESVPYLASWAQSAPLETIEATAKLIDRLARRIEDALESAADAAEAEEEPSESVPQAV